MKPFPKLIEVTPLTGYRLLLKYNDGVSGEVDLSALKGKGVFSIWNDENNFKKVFIDNKNGAVAWNDGLDLCPDSLYLQLTHKTFSEYAAH